MKSIIITTVAISIGLCLIAGAYLLAEAKKPPVRDQETQRESDSGDVAESEPAVRSLLQPAETTDSFPGEPGRAVSSPPQRPTRRTSRPQNEIKQLYRQLESKMARVEKLKRSGKKGELKEAQQEINKLENLIEELEEQQGEDRGESPFDDNPMSRGEFPPGVVPDFPGEPGRPPIGEPAPRGPRGNLRNRIEHVRQAARHLEEAGLHERARDLQEEAEKMEQDLRGNGDDDVRKIVHLIQQLRNEMKGLHREVRDLRKQMGGKDRGDNEDRDENRSDPDEADTRGNDPPFKPVPSEAVNPIDAGEPDRPDFAPEF